MDKEGNERYKKREMRGKREERGGRHEGEEDWKREEELREIGWRRLAGTDVWVNEGDAGEVEG